MICANVISNTNICIYGMYLFNQSSFYIVTSHLLTVLYQKIIESIVTVYSREKLFAVFFLQ